MSLSSRFAHIQAPDTENSDNEQIAPEEKQLLARLLGKIATQYSSSAELGVSFGRGGTIIHSDSEDNDDLDADWQKDFKAILEKKKSGSQFKNVDVQEDEDSKSCLKLSSDHQSAEHKKDLESKKLCEQATVQLDKGVVENGSVVDKCELFALHDDARGAINQASTGSNISTPNEAVCYLTDSQVPDNKSRNNDMKGDGYDASTGSKHQRNIASCSLSSYNASGNESSEECTESSSVQTAKQKKQSNTNEILKEKFCVLQNELKDKKSTATYIDDQFDLVSPEDDNLRNRHLAKTCIESRKRGAENEPQHRNDCEEASSKRVKNKVSYPTPISCSNVNTRTLKPKASSKEHLKQKEKKRKQYIIVPSSSCPLDELLPINKENKNEDSRTEKNVCDLGISNKTLTNASDLEGQQFFDQNVWGYAPTTFPGTIYSSQPDYGYASSSCAAHYELYSNPLFTGSFPGTILTSQYHVPGFENTSVSRNAQSMHREVHDKDMVQGEATSLNSNSSADSKSRTLTDTNTTEKQFFNLSAGNCNSLNLNACTRESSVHNYRPHARPGFYQELGALNPSVEQTAVQPDDGCEKLFELLVQQCSALIKTEEGKDKINTMLDEIKKQGGDRLKGAGFKQGFDNLTGTSFTPTNSEDSRPSNLEAAICNAPSPIPSPAKTLNEVFEGRTLLKGGVKPRHIPKTTIYKDGKHKPTDPRSFPVKTRDVKLKLPKFLAILSGKKMVEKIRFELNTPTCSKKSLRDGRKVLKSELESENKKGNSGTEILKGTKTSSESHRNSYGVENLIAEKSNPDTPSTYGKTFEKQLNVDVPSILDEVKNGHSSLEDSSSIETVTNPIPVLITNSVEKSQRKQSTRNPVLQNIMNSFDVLGREQNQFPRSSSFFPLKPSNRPSVAIVKPIQIKLSVNSDQQQLDSKCNASVGNKLEEAIITQGDVDVEAAWIKSLENKRVIDVDVKENVVSEFEERISLSDISDGELSDTSGNKTPTSERNEVIEKKTFPEETALVSSDKDFDDSETPFPLRRSKHRSSSRSKSMFDGDLHKSERMKTRSRSSSSSNSEKMSGKCRRYRSSSSDSSHSQWSRSERFGACNIRNRVKDSSSMSERQSSSTISNSRKQWHRKLSDDIKHHSSRGNRDAHHHDYQTKLLGVKQCGNFQKRAGWNYPMAQARSEENEHKSNQKLPLRSHDEHRQNDEHRSVGNYASNRESFWKRTDAEKKRERRLSCNTQRSNISHESRKRHHTSVDESFNRDEKIPKLDLEVKRRYSHGYARHNIAGTLDNARSKITGYKVDARLKLDAKQQMSKNHCAVPVFQTSESHSTPKAKYNTYGDVDLKIVKTYKPDENMNNIKIVIPGNQYYSDHEGDKIEDEPQAKVSRLSASKSLDVKIKDSYELDRQFLEDYKKKLDQRLKSEKDEKAHRTLATRVYHVQHTEPNREGSCSDTDKGRGVLLYDDMLHLADLEEGEAF